MPKRCCHVVNMIFSSNNVILTKILPTESLTLPYPTLPSGRTGVSCPALRSYLFGPVRIPDVTVGQSSLLEVLTNRKRERGLTLLSSSNSSRYDPKMEYLCCILAEHLPKKWKQFLLLHHMLNTVPTESLCLETCITFLALYPCSNQNDIKCQVYNILQGHNMVLTSILHGKVRNRRLFGKL